MACPRTVVRIQHKQKICSFLGRKWALCTRWWWCGLNVKWNKINGWSRKLHGHYEIIFVMVILIWQYQKFNVNISEFLQSNINIYMKFFLQQSLRFLKSSSSNFHKRSASHTDAIRIILHFYPLLCLFRKYPLENIHTLIGCSLID